MTEHPIIQNSIRWTQYLLGRYRDDRCSEIAAALVYMSLFALVPLLTVIYAIGSAVPTATNLEQQLEQFLVSNLLPDASQEVAGYLASFSEQAKNLTGAGIAILLVTAVLMLRNVEKAFNTIWRIRENRGPVASFLLYWAVLSLAPMLIGLGVGAQAWVYAAANAVSGFDALGIGALLLSTLPFMLSVLGLSALYMAVPNCDVPFKHALLGGLFAAIAFGLARTAFTAVIARSSYALVYGAFAAVPVFLLWLYITWTIVLLGAVLVHSQSAFQTGAQAARPLLLKALDVLYLLWRAQRTGNSLGELDILRERTVISEGLDGESWRIIRDRLVSLQWVAQDSHGRYLLSRDLTTVSLNQLRAAVTDERPLPEPLQTATGWQSEVILLLAEQRRSQSQALAITLDQLFKEGNEPAN